MGSRSSSLPPAERLVRPDPLEPGGEEGGTQAPGLRVDPPEEATGLGRFFLQQADCSRCVFTGKW